MKKKFLLLPVLTHASTTQAFSASLPRQRTIQTRPHRYPRPISDIRLYQTSPSSPDESPKKPDTTPLSSSSSQDSNASSHQSSSSSLSTNTSSLQEDDVPSYKAIVLFVSTTILIWLSEPLLSLVDTTIVGRQAGHSLTQLAALSPATMLIDSLVYLTYFLSIATTCKMASSLAQRDYKEMITTTSQILGVAAVLGAIITGTIFLFGQPLLTWCAGDAGNAALITAALQYSKIRCSVSILSIVGMVSQSICLAVRDVTTPAVAVGVASIVNVIGDLVLIPKFGLKGAAAATATASVASALVLLQSIVQKTTAWKLKAKETTGVVNGSKINGDSINGNNDTFAAATVVVDGKPVLNATRAVVWKNDTDSSRKSNNNSNKSTKVDTIPFVSLPDRRSTFELINLAGPIFFVIMMKVLCYSSLTLKATAFGVLPLAAHNIMMRVFFFHATFGDSLTQAAQTYLPSTLLQKNNNNAKVLLKKLTIMATAIGIFSCVSIKAILRMGHFFTGNTDIISSMAKHTTSISLAAFLHSFIMLFEGAIIAIGDLPFLVTSYAITMGILLAQLRYASPHFAGVWIALLLFQVLRLVQFKSRVVHKVLLRQKPDEGSA